MDILCITNPIVYDEQLKTEINTFGKRHPVLLGTCYY